MVEPVPLIPCPLSVLVSSKWSAVDDAKWGSPGGITDPDVAGPDARRFAREEVPGIFWLIWLGSRGGAATKRG